MKKSVAFLFTAVGALALALFIGRAWANPGAFDLSWGSGGVARFTFSENGDLVTASQLDSDGKVVIAGWVNGYPGEFGVARFLIDGTPDPAFGEEGKVMTRFGNDADLPNAAWSIGPRPGGGYLVAGEICDVDYVICQWLTAAYTHDGTLDESFDEDGWITTTVEGADGVYAWPPANLLQADGKSIVGGVVLQPGGDVDIALRRHNTDGSLDDTFGDDGLTVIDVDEKVNYMEHMALLPDGKIIVLGGIGESVDAFTYIGDTVYLLRLNEDGSIDDGFGTNGVAQWSDDGGLTHPEGLGLSPEGEIYVSGGVAGEAENETDCAVWNVDAGGALDMDFGDGGLLRIDDGADEFCYTANVMPDGKIAITGDISPLESGRSSNGRIRQQGGPGSRAAVVSNTLDVLVARVNPDGTLDETFGDGGFLLQDIEEKDNEGASALVQPDGKIVVVGNVFDGETELSDISISRFLGEERPKPERIDPTWGDEGISFAAFEGGDESGFAQLMQPDDKVIVSGWANIWPGDFGAARFLPNGDLDTDFGDGGRVTTAFTEDPTLVDASYAISGRSNGGFFLFGETCDADYFICQLAVAAYLEDGTLDDTFGGDGKVVTDPGGDTSLSWPNRILSQPDGGLVAAGVVYQESGDVDIVLVKYKANGDLDESFGDGGIAIQDFNEVENYPQDMLQLPDGKILLAGGFSELADDEIDYQPSDAYLARFTSEGELDTTFGGGDGFVTWDYGDDLGALGQRAFLHPDGGLLVLGASFTDVDPGDCTLQRFDMDGVMDMTYGDEGWVTIDSGHDDFCWDMELTDDRMVVFTGWATHPADPESRAAAGDAGQVDRRLLRSPAAMATRSASMDNSFDNLLGRYHIDGRPDTTFGDNGLVRFRVNEARAYIHGIGIQSNSNYVVSGDAMTGPNYDFVALRFKGYGPVVQVFLPAVQR